MVFFSSNRNNHFVIIKVNNHSQISTVDQLITPGIFSNTYLDAVFLELLLELSAALQELPLLGLVLLLDGAQLGFQLLLVHSEALHLSLQHLTKHIKQQ